VSSRLIDWINKAGKSRALISYIAFCFFVFSCLFFLLSFNAFAHPGGLNSSGCHNNLKTGDYHCHRFAEPSNLAVNPEQQNLNSRSIYFKNCTEARALGFSPIRKGEPGYGLHLDRDRDGVACEPYR
jgi:hypothetical protein